MKKWMLVVLALSLASVACSLQKVELTTVPSATPKPTNVPTQEPSATPAPTLTSAPSQALPSPTAIPPTETTAPTIPVQPTETMEELNEIFSDDFNDAAGSWYTGDTETTSTHYVNNAIEFKLSQDNWLMWSESAEVYTSDVVVTVDSALINGTAMNSQGILCRYVDTDNFYALMVGNDGYYEIIKYKDGESVSLAGDFAEDGLVNPLKNQITASCLGDQLSLNVNGVVLYTAFDSDLRMGDVGLIIGTFDDPDVTIQFDNFVVYAPKQ